MNSGNSLGDHLQGDDLACFCDWCHYMRNADLPAASIIVTAAADPFEHARVWQLFDKWQSWQEDFSRTHDS